MEKLSDNDLQEIIEAALIVSEKDTEKSSLSNKDNNLYRSILGNAPVYINWNIKE